MHEDYFFSFLHCLIIISLYKAMQSLNSIPQSYYNDYTGTLIVYSLPSVIILTYAT